MNPADIIGGLVAGGVGDIASGFLGITSGGILVPLLILLGNEQHVAQGISLVAIGGVAGWSSGFLGIGGGLAITALMAGLLKISQHRSQAVSLVTALPV